MNLTEQQIENGFYEAIRLKVVEKGYLPNVVNFIGNQTGWDAAISAIKASGKKCIYVENAGSYKGREDLEENCIIIDLDDKGPSQTGTKSVPVYTYQEAETNFKKDLSPDGIFDLMYRVSIVAYDKTYHDIMSQILNEAIRFRGYMKAYDNAGNEVGKFRIQVGNYVNLDSNKFMERAQFYYVPSVDLIGCTDAGTVARAEEITIGISTNNEIQDDEIDDISITIP